MGKAQVFVNGDLRAQSDDRGQYTLSNMSAGKCTIKVSPGYSCDYHVTIM